MVPIGTDGTGEGYYSVWRNWPSGPPYEYRVEVTSFVMPDGTVVPCQSWLNYDADLGNILTDKFSDIWKNKKCLELRGMTDEEALICPFRNKSGVSSK